MRSYLFQFHDYDPTVGSWKALCASQRASLRPQIISDLDLRVYPSLSSIPWEVGERFPYVFVVCYPVTVRDPYQMANEASSALGNPFGYSVSSPSVLTPAICPVYCESVVPLVGDLEHADIFRYSPCRVRCPSFVLPPLHSLFVFARLVENEDGRNDILVHLSYRVSYVHGKKPKT